MAKGLKKKIKNCFILFLATLATVAVVTAAIFAVDFYENTKETSLSQENYKIIEGKADETITAPVFHSNSVSQEADGTIVCESIIQGVKDCDLPDGTYNFKVTGTTDGTTNQTITYRVEIINAYGDTTYDTSVSLGDATTERKMLVVKYHGNLTINSGVTVIARAISTTFAGKAFDITYKKGMYLCVMGDLVNNGTITMTGRGTYNQGGENVYLWKNMKWDNIQNKYEYVPAAGAGGAGSAALPRKTRTRITKRKWIYRRSRIRKKNRRRRLWRRRWWLE
ncbi:MAG: hypothetical protein K2H53_05490 [Clostridia bacterium]|nr:hypothetical protein [Clostridia bacterium]